MRNYLTFDNKDSRDFGVYINGQGTFRAPARSYNVLNIPGRNGDLLGFGSKLENVEITYRAFIYTNFDANIAALRSFLLSHVGYFKLTDIYHPDEYRLAYYKGPFVPDVVANNGAGSFDLTFVCKPQRFLNSGEEVTTLTPAGAEQHTYQGEIVNFSTLAGDKITSARADFHPIQDLHGYSSPWPAGGGKNLFDFDQTVGTTTIETSPILLQPGTYYVYVAAKSPNFYSYVQISSDGTSFSNIGTDSSVLTAYADKTMGYNQRKCILTVVSATYCRQRLQINSNVQNARIAVMYTTDSTGYSSVPVNMTYNSPEWQAVYRPYSNICPITGRTGLNVYRTGKNLFDQGSFAWNNSQTIHYVSMPIPNGTYTFSTNFASNPTRDVFVFAGQVTSGADSGSNGVDSSTPRTITIVDGYWTLATRYNSARPKPSEANWQLELGSTATTYEPYNGNTYSVDWTSEAGTVYGGTLDVVTGVLTVDRAMADLGDFTWELWPGYSSVFRTAIPSGCKLVTNNTVPDWLASIYKVVKGTDIATNNATIGMLHQTYLTAHNDSYTDAATFKTAMSGVQLCYELATPLTYQLTPQEVEALADNYMWSDVGQVTVTVTDAMTIENPTLFDAKPLLRVYGAGTLTLGGQTITISTADVYTDIDCEMMDCFKDTVSKNGNVSFSGYDFPVIPPGRNVITMDGVTQVDITPRWWAA